MIPSRLLKLINVFFITQRVVMADYLTEEEYSKFTVSGNYSANVTVDRSNSSSDTFTINATGLPDHEWERIDSSTPSNQNYSIPIPRNPENNRVPGCVPLGIIGLARTGVALFNPLDRQLENAVEGSGAEVFDSCDGHSTPDNGAYHYHKLPQSCLYKNEADEFIGVALDGYPIYGPKVSAGVIMHGNLSQGGNVTSAHLDKCHGTTVNGRYRYYITHEFPYILGCFRGTIKYQAQRVTYNCENNTSIWNDAWNYYLCHCTSGMQGGMQGGFDRRPECAPENPNRPQDCPVLHDCSPDNTNRPQICDQLCSRNNNMPRPPSCDATTMRSSRATTSQSSVDNTKGPTEGAECSIPKITLILCAIIIQTFVFT